LHVEIRDTSTARDQEMISFSMSNNSPSEVAIMAEEIYEEIYVDPGAGAASRILVGGVWYVRAGGSDADFAFDLEDIDDSSCDSCGEFQHQVVGYMVSNNQSGASFIRAHGLP
jgi:hypothetical protein